LRLGLHHSEDVADVVAVVAVAAAVFEVLVVVVLPEVFPDGSQLLHRVPAEFEAVVVVLAGVVADAAVALVLWISFKKLW
jgi:hypothetical protein